MQQRALRRRVARAASEAVMWRLARRLLVGVSVLMLCLAVVGAVWQARAERRDQEAVPPPGRLVDVGGHRLHLWCTGAGTPTVVLDSGLNGVSFDWGAVQPRVAAFTRVCSYDRAGIGYSDRGPRPRTSDRLADELWRLLEAGGVEGPLVLGGASFGAWTVRLVAGQHPDRVVGLVLVDGRHEDTTARLAERGIAENPPWMAWAARVLPWAATVGLTRWAGFSPVVPPQVLDPAVREFARATRFRASAFAAGASELTSGDESARQVRQSRRVLDVPLVVVSAGRRGGRASDAIVDELQTDQVRLSARACQVVATRAGHGITFQQPAIVVEALRETVDAARAGSRGPDCQLIARAAQ